MPTRLLIGLSVGSGGEAADAAAVRADGVGLAMTPTVAGAARVPLPSDVREAIRRAGRDGTAVTREAGRQVGEALGLAARQAAAKAGGDLRAALAAGLIGGSADARGLFTSDPGPADWLAEATGLTVVTGFRDRDAAAGGSGRLTTAAADYLLFRHPAENRLLIQLGSTASVLFIPSGGKVSAVAGFEAGPGTRLLDDITSLGTRGRDAFDPGGTKAVQGRCLDDLLVRWLTHPHLSKKPPKAVPRGAFGLPFLTDAFSAARSSGGTLHDLLCTATHFVARCVGDGVRRWLPPAGPTRAVAVAGGGVRNGFLWQRVEAEFPGLSVGRTDGWGVPALSRPAAAAAVLAALALDGVAANLPLLTGAAGGRLVGRFTPGDARSWAACTAWMARQTVDYLPLGRAA